MSRPCPPGADAPAGPLASVTSRRPVLAEPAGGTACRVAAARLRPSDSCCRTHAALGTAAGTWSLVVLVGSAAARCPRMPRPVLVAQLVGESMSYMTRSSADSWQSARPLCLICWPGPIDGFLEDVGMPGGVHKPPPPVAPWLARGAVGTTRMGPGAGIRGQARSGRGPPVRPWRRRTAALAAPGPGGLCGRPAGGGGGRGAGCASPFRLIGRRRWPPAALAALAPSTVQPAHRCPSLFRPCPATPDSPSSSRRPHCRRQGARRRPHGPPGKPSACSRRPVGNLKIFPMPASHVPDGLCVGEHSPSQRAPATALWEPAPWPAEPGCRGVSLHCRPPVLGRRPRYATEMAHRRFAVAVSSHLTDPSRRPPAAMRPVDGVPPAHSLGETHQLLHLVPAYSYPQLSRCRALPLQMRRDEAGHAECASQRPACASTNALLAARHPAAPLVAGKALALPLASMPAPPRSCPCPCLFFFFNNPPPLSCPG